MLTGMMESPWWLVAGWTMLHFLWAGTLIGLLAAVSRWLLGAAGPNVRYVFAVACFLALTATPLLIAVQIKLPTAPPPELAETPAYSNREKNSTMILPAGQPVSLMSDAPVIRSDYPVVPAESADAPQSDAISQESHTFSFAGVVVYFPWVWLIGTPLTFLIVVTSLLGAERLRGQSQLLDTGPLPRRCGELAASLRIMRRIKVGICDRIASPVLIGILRPIILLPPAALAGWSMEQAEMVLLHELAHLRRWDNLVNLLQRVIESVLFFHPAVWLASRWVRVEREHCCDHFAVTHCGRPRDYAEMLARMAAPGTLPVHAAAMAENNLVSRIRKVLNLEDQAMKLSRKFVSFVGIMMITSVFMMALLAQQAASEQEPSDKSNKPANRIIHFPEDRSLGILYIRDTGPHEPSLGPWERFAEARGAVMVPADRLLRLDVSRDAVSDLSPLERLKPDDLFDLMLWRTPADDASLTHIAGLTDLKVLTLRYTHITNDGLKNLRNMDSLWCLTLDGTKVGDDGLAHLAGLKNLEILSLGHTQITDAGLAHLAGIPSLKTISLRYTDITDAGLVHLRNLTSLTNLSFSNSDITDQGLACLSSLTAMEDLTLDELHLTEASLVHLKSMPSLKKLSMHGFKIDDPGLAHVKELKALEELSVDRGTITPNGLTALSELPGLKKLSRLTNDITEEELKCICKIKTLEELRILGDGVTDAGMDHVAKMVSLKDLALSHCPVTDQGLTKLTALKSLERLSLNHTNTTCAGLASLKALPKLKDLRLFRIECKEAGLACLADLTDLEWLELEDMSLQDDDLVHLAKLTRLKTLFINIDTLSDGAFAHLAGLTALEDITACGPKLTNKALTYLTGMKKLETIQITGDFTDEGLESLEILPSLRGLTISGERLTDAGLTRLRKKLPSLQYLETTKSEPIAKAPEIGDIAPPFALQTLDGKNLKLEDYRGKVVLLYFWATWCNPCVASTPALKQFYNDLSRHKDFAMISLSLDDKEQEFLPRRHAERHGLTWPQACLGHDSQVAADYGIRGVASYILIGPNGKVLLSRERDWDKIKEAAEKALKQIPTTSASNVGDRIIHFPEDRSLGILWIRTPEPYPYVKPTWASCYYDGWERFSEARGTITVAMDKQLKLQVSRDAVSDLSSLVRLGPDDLFEIDLQNTAADDSSLNCMAGLTGLQVLNLLDTRITDEGLKHIRGLVSLRSLDLKRTQIGDEGLACLTGLRNLVYLDLFRTNITDAGLAHLTCMTSLKGLRLIDTDISDIGLAHLKNLTSLTDLTLAQNDITDEGLRHLSNLTAMENLDLWSLRFITDAGLAYLKPMRSLKRLYITGGYAINDAGLAHLKELKSLEVLFIRPGDITEEGLAALSELPALKRLGHLDRNIDEGGLKILSGIKSLEELDIGGEGVTDAGMEHVAKLVLLKSLSLSDCPVTDQGLAKLTSFLSLEDLSLFYTKTTGAGLVYLKSLPNLKRLWLTHVESGEAGLTHLADMTSLEWLGLRDISLRNDDLKPLSRLTCLKILEIDTDTLSDGAFAWLAGLTGLERLDAQGPKLTDQALTYLSNMKKLRSLQISNGDFTDEGLTYLEALSSLDWLQIPGDGLSREGLDRLQRKFPSLHYRDAHRNSPIPKELEIGAVAPSFSVNTIDGKSFSLENYRGKLVLVHFWATWCGPCVNSMPALKELHKELSRHKDIALISLSQDRHESVTRRFAEHYGLTWPQACLNQDPQIAEAYGINGVPTYYLIGPDGKVVFTCGGSDFDKIKEAAEKALAAGPKAVTQRLSDPSRHDETGER